MVALARSTSGKDSRESIPRQALEKFKPALVSMRGKANTESQFCHADVKLVTLPVSKNGNDVKLPHPNQAKLRVVTLPVLAALNSVSCDRLKQIRSMLVRVVALRISTEVHRLLVN